MDYKIFEATPGISVLLLPNPPFFTHVAVTDDFIRASGMQRADVIGNNHFDLFPKSPDGGEEGVLAIKASFMELLHEKKPQQLPVQRYDIPDGNGGFAERYWSVTNAPVLDADGNLEFIIHTAVDITIETKSRQRERVMDGIEKAFNLFMQAPVIIGIVKGDDHRIELANPALLKLWGRGREVLGKPLLEAIPELHGQGFTELLDEVRRTGKTAYADEDPSMLVRNGVPEVRYLNFVYEPYYESAGDKIAAGVFAVAHDVTLQVNERKKLEEVTERLNYRNALFEALNETTQDGVLIVGPKGKITLFNNRYAEIWKTPQEIIDSGDDEAALQHAMTMLADPEGFKKKVNELYAHQREKSYDLVQFKDGRIIERTGTPIISENGLYYGWAWNFRDITERIQQEQKFRNVVQQATDPILILKGEHMVLEVANQALFHLWNVDETAIGKKFLEILPEMEGQGFLELLQRVYFTGEAFQGFEVPVVFERNNGDKETRYFTFTYQPYREADGSITGVLVLATDVSAQVLAKRQLVESERNFRSMVLAAPVAICILKGEDLIVEIANDRMLQLIAQPADQVIGKPLFKGFPEGVHQGLETLLQNVYRTGESFTAHERVIRLPRDGKFSTAYLDFVYEPIQEGDGSIGAIMVVVMDVTAQVLARKRLEESEQELQSRVDARTAELAQKNAELEQYAHVSSHDLQEPLRKIKTFREMIRERDYHNLSDFSKEKFNKIGEAVDRMSTTLKDLLNFTSIDKGARFTTVDLNEVLQVVLSDLELVIEQKQASVRNGVLPVINAIPLQMHQLFYNLVNNALKFSREGLPPQVLISVTSAGDSLVTEKGLDKGRKYYHFTIQDNGIGFSQEHASKIFLMFQRLHNRQKFSGTGIGLALVKKVAENHAGAIWAEGKPGEGALFHVLIPDSN